MTDVTIPAEIDAAIDNLQMAHALSKSGGHSGYVVSGVDLSALEPSINTNGVNSFSRASNSGLNFTINGGEAFCYGWFCRDRTTTITLPASTTSTVCVGYDPDDILGAAETPSANENIIVDIEANFTDRQPYLPLYDVTTTASAVSSWNSVRALGPENAPSNAFASEGEFSDVQASYNSFRSTGGTIGGDVTIGDDLTVSDLLTVNGSATIGNDLVVTDTATINGQTLDMPNASGNAGLRLGSGAKFSLYEGKATVYSYSGEGGTGFRFRNPNSGGDHFTVDNITGAGWFKGPLEADGDDVPTASEPMRLVISSTQPTDYDIWFEVE